MFKATKRKIEPEANTLFNKWWIQDFIQGGEGTKIIFCGRQKLENKEKKV